MAIILSKQERVVMQSLYDLAKGKQNVLIGVEDIMGQIKPDGKFCLKHPKQEYVPDLPEVESVPGQEETVEEAVAVEEKKRQRFWRRRTEEEEPLDVPKTVQKIYVDEPPVYKGLRVYEKPVHYDELPHIVEILYMEEYIDLTPASDEGETKYIVRLLNRGRRWERDERDRKRNAGIRLLTIIATPILSFVLGILLKFLF